MLCNATASPPPHRLQSVNETRAAGSRERQTEGVKVERGGERWEREKTRKRMKRETDEGRNQITAGV